MTRIILELSGDYLKENKTVFGYAVYCNTSDELISPVFDTENQADRWLSLYEEDGLRRSKFIMQQFFNKEE